MKERVQHLKDMGYSEPSINKHHMILSRIFRKFEEYREGGFVGGQDFKRIRLPLKNPAALVRKVDERQFARRVFISPDQKKILCSYADEDLCEIIRGLYWTQLRPSDFFAITNANLDLQQRVIFGVQHKTITSNKPGGVPYKVPIPEQCMDAIIRRVRDTKPGTPIFRKTNMQKRWQVVRKLAGMPWLQIRDLRGSAASHLLNEGVNPKTVADSLGHTSLRLIGNYDKTAEERLKRAKEILVRVK